MANTLTAIVPKILAMALLSLREFCMMPQLVNGDYSSDAAKFGSTIDVPVPQAQTVGDVTPSNTPPAPQSQTPTTVQIPLNKWKKTEFFLTDKEMKEIDRNQSFFPMQASEAIRALANQVNADIWANYKGVYGYVGTAGTTPFATTVAGATDLDKVLNNQVCPPNGRNAITDFNARANMLALAAFANFEQTGDPLVKIDGIIGKKYGFMWGADHAVPTHTAGTITTGLISKASTSYAVGVKTILATTAASTGACALKEGDIILFAGDTQTYVLTADATQASAASDVTLTFEPGLKVAHTGSEAVSVKASHVVNLGFHRNAIAFANRRVSELEFKGGSIIEQMTDPATGLSLALEISRQYHQTVWEFSMLYGSKLVRPELAARLAG